MKALILALILFLSMSAQAEVTIRYFSEIDSLSINSLKNKITKAIDKFDASDERVITIHLSSGGGEIALALDFIRFVNNTKYNRNVEINTRVNGRPCESACTMMFTIGTHRYAAANANFGFHSPALGEGVSLPRGIMLKDVIEANRTVWVREIRRVDPQLADRLVNEHYLLHPSMRFIKGSELTSGYVTDLE